MSRPLAVAVTGGIGAGKSEALAAFRRHGAATVSSDEIVHRLLQEDPAWRDLLLFHEYFHGETGAGLGASHQTGWTGLVANLILGRAR